MHRLKQTALGIEIAVDHAFQTLGDLVQHAFAQLPRVIENPGELGLRLRHKVIKGPDNGGIEVPDQNLDQRIPQHHLSCLTHLLTHQKQHRPQAHPRCRHGRRCRQDANQIDAQTHPVQRVAFLTGRQPDDVIQRINQRHDVAHHRQKARSALDPFKRNDPAADVPKPGIDIGSAGPDVLKLNQIKRNDRQLRLVFCVAAGRNCGVCQGCSPCSKNHPKRRECQSGGHGDIKGCANYELAKQNQ
ncbi:hypothetical protein [Pseudomonas graminis]|uniref:hypothetical protein n=1 Tax=Pseudomonas graminis TaxID=158627 RepID=UPI0020B15B31|nr:hypothetical protein [Pseudomonas graminis]